MKLRVRNDAKKGHFVAGVMIQPGQELPGEYDAIPPGMGNKLEEVQGGGARQKRAQPAAQSPDDRQSSGEGSEADWYAKLSEDLGHEPTKADLIEHGRTLGLTLDDQPRRKDEMIDEIGAAQG